MGYLDGVDGRFLGQRTVRMRPVGTGCRCRDLYRIDSRFGLAYNGAMNTLPYSSFLLLPDAQVDLVVLRPHLCGEG